MWQFNRVPNNPCFRAKIRKMTYVPETLLPEAPDPVTCFMRTEQTHEIFEPRRVSRLEGEVGMHAFSNAV